MSICKLLLPLIGIVVLTGCKNRPDRGQATDLNGLQQTEFVTTLESPLTPGKNSIYMSSFVFAWDKLKQALGSPVVLTDTSSPDLITLDNCISFQHALPEKEYNTETRIEDSNITVRTSFEKELLFEKQMQVTASLIFGNSSVSSFGIEQYDMALTRFTDILYYEDDNSFIVRLTPKDTLHEIILAKGFNKNVTLAGAVKQTQDVTARGKAEAHKATAEWKYHFDKEDKLSIPVVDFDIQTNYKTLEGQALRTNNKNRFIATAWQRTALALNATGARISSEAEVTMALDSAAVVKHPKMLFFNGPFLIIIKQKTSNNPYFVMRVENAELLKPEQR